MEDKETPYIRANREENKIYFGENVSKSSFFKDLEIQPNDVLIAVNGKKYDLNNARYLFEVSKQWIKGTVILVTIRRNGVEFTVETKIKEGPTSLQKSLIEIPDADLTQKQIQTKKAWLN